MGAGHSHSHHDGPQLKNRLSLAFGITLVILVAQAIGAVWTGSLALLTDTVHMLVDAGGLAIALVAANLMSRPASARRTWGFRRIEVIAALAQAFVLLGVGIYVAFEGVARLFSPPDIASGELLIFGVVGLVGNLVALGVLTSSRQANFNMRAAFLEVLNDALGSVAVIIAALVIAISGWHQADALAALFIAVLIVPRAYVLLRDTTKVLMEFTPPGLDLDDVRRHMLSLDHVRDVHDLHASVVATGLPVISAHVVVDDECFQDGHAPEILEKLKTCVAGHFDVAIEHSTFQVETAELADSEPHKHA